MITVYDKPKRITCPHCGEVYRITYKANKSPKNWITICSVCQHPMGVEPNPILAIINHQQGKTMAKRKRATAKKAAAKKATPKDKAGGDKKLQAGQKDLPGVDTDRVPRIETIVKKIVGKESQKKLLAEEINELRDKLPPLFKKNKLVQYSCHGKKVLIEPGADVVKIKKAKAQ